MEKKPDPFVRWGSIAFIVCMLALMVYGSLFGVPPNAAHKPL